MNLFTNLYNKISSLYKYILDKYAYKNITLYIVKLSPMLMNLFINSLLCLSLTCLRVEPKLGA